MTDTKDPALQNQLKRYAEHFPIGIKVRFWPVAGEQTYEDCEIRSEPWALGHGAIVIKVTGRAGGVLVDHLARL